MIDWTRLRFSFLHDPIPTGHVMSIRSDGLVEWESPKKLNIRGSYESNFLIRSQGGDGQGRATELYIDGNPSKFLQGHNVFGSENLIPLVEETLKKICFCADIPSDFLLQKARKGEFEVLGLHIARSFDAQTKINAHAIQDFLSLNSKTKAGRCQSLAGTNYWNMASRKNRWLGKSYLKGEEINSRKKSHRLPKDLQNLGLEDFSENLIRIEFEIYKQEFIERANPLIYGHQFTPEVIDQLYFEYWSRVKMSTQAHIASEELLSMPRAIRSSYLMWCEGINVRTHMSKPTFYRHRSELLGLGVDIAIPNDHEVSNVVPLIRIIEATPIGTPDWAYEKGLVFDK